jgi:hypothetical protein
VFTRWPYLHFGQYAMVRRGGLASANLGRIGAFPIRMKQAHEYPMIDVFRPEDFRYSENGRMYDFFLSRALGNPQIAAPDGAIEPVFSRGEWALYRNRE